MLLNFLLWIHQFLQIIIECLAFTLLSLCMLLTSKNSCLPWILSKPNYTEMSVFVLSKCDCVLILIYAGRALTDLFTIFDTNVASLWADDCTWLFDFVFIWDFVKIVSIDFYSLSWAITWWFDHVDFVLGSVWELVVLSLIYSLKFWVLGFTLVSDFPSNKLVLFYRFLVVFLTS